MSESGDMREAAKSHSVMTGPPHKPCFLFKYTHTFHGQNDMAELAYLPQSEPPQNGFGHSFLLTPVEVGEGLDVPSCC